MLFSRGGIHVGRGHLLKKESCLSRGQNLVILEDMVGATAAGPQRLTGSNFVRGAQDLRDGKPERSQGSRAAGWEPAGRIQVAPSHSTLHAGHIFYNRQVLPRRLVSDSGFGEPPPAGQCTRPTPTARDRSWDQSSLLALNKELSMDFRQIPNPGKRKNQTSPGAGSQLGNHSVKNSLRGRHGNTTHALHTCNRDSWTAKKAEATCGEEESD